MKRRQASLPRQADGPTEPPLDLDDDDEDFDTLDTVEIVVTEHNGSSSRVICVAMDGDTTGVVAVPPPPPANRSRV